jgi:hypothetical protein
MTLRNRIKAALRYFRALRREPVSKREAKARSSRLHEQLRREVIEQQLVRAVREAIR